MKFVLHQCPLKLVTEKSPLIKLKKLWLSHGTGKWATRLLQSTQCPEPLGRQPLSLRSTSHRRATRQKGWWKGNGPLHPCA